METLDVTIDELDLEQEILNVRGKSLVELIGSISFCSAIYHILTGKLPSADVERTLNRYLVNCMRHSLIESDKYLLLRNMAKYSHDLESLLMVTLLLFEDTARKNSKTLLPKKLTSLEDSAEGLYLMSILPVILHMSLSNDFNIKTIHQNLGNYCELYSDDFVGLMLNLISDKEMSSTKKELMNALLVGLHAGFGIITPTIVLSRFSASTRASITKNIVAGLTGCGVAHVGACKIAMILLKQMQKYEINDNTDDLINEVFCKQKPFPGFGHPILHQDPRNQKLLSLAERTAQNSIYFILYRKIQAFIYSRYGLYPNVDFIAAAILLDLGVSESLGTCIFLISRIPTMIAHAIEKKKAPPFGINSKEAREHFAVIPKRWI